jgi:hypothetical protein
VAGSAVGYGEFAVFVGYSMIAAHISAQAVGGKAITPDDFLVHMALRACGYNVGRIDF